MKTLSVSQKLLVTKNYLIDFQAFILLAAIFITSGEHDGKYRSAEKAFQYTEVPSTTTKLRNYPTTTSAPFYRNTDPRYEWNSRRHWPADHYEPRYDSRLNANSKGIASFLFIACLIICLLRQMENHQLQDPTMITAPFVQNKRLMPKDIVTCKKFYQPNFVNLFSHFKSQL